ncbi:MAG: gamma-glutamylcyclotransferase family protein [Nitrospirales bacterium]
MSDALFVYGTLQFSEVVEAVTGMVLPWVKAEAPGFAQFRFTDRIYPGLVAREGALTQGRVYTGLSHQVWELLDRFEDPIYRRELVEVYRSDGSKMMSHAYVVPLAQQHLLSSQLWQMDWFSDVHLDGYVSRCRLFYEAINSEGLPESRKQTLWKLTDPPQNSQS